MESKEELLLKAIFSTEDEPDDNFPETVIEKVGYAEYVMTHSLEYIGKTLHRLSRLYNLLTIQQKDGKSTLPDIITHNELRMALTPLLQVENDIKDITEMLKGVFEDTKPPKEEDK